MAYYIIQNIKRKKKQIRNKKKKQERKNVIKVTSANGG